MKPMDRAVYWVEYVLRHDGAGHLKSRTSTMYYTEYFSIDICFVILSILLISVFLLVKIATWVVKSNSIKLKEKKKKK